MGQLDKDAARSSTSIDNAVEQLVEFALNNRAVINLGPETLRLAQEHSLTAAQTICLTDTILRAAIGAGVAIEMTSPWPIGHAQDEETSPPQP